MKKVCTLLALFLVVVLYAQPVNLQTTTQINLTYDNVSLAGASTHSWPLSRFSPPSSLDRDLEPSVGDLSNNYSCKPVRLDYIYTYVISQRLLPSRARSPQASQT